MTNYGEIKDISKLIGHLCSEITMLKKLENAGNTFVIAYPQRSSIVKSGLPTYSIIYIPVTLYRSLYCEHTKHNMVFVTKIEMGKKEY